MRNSKIIHQQLDVLRRAVQRDMMLERVDKDLSLNKEVKEIAKALLKSEWYGDYNSLIYTAKNV